MNRFSRPISVFILIVALSLPFDPAFSQSFKGTILGTVKDETGAVLAGATVTITNVNTGLTRTILTNDTGDYLVPLLPPGEYQVSAELSGFKKEVISGIILQVEQKARVDITLAVGEISEVVNVIGSAPLTQTDTAAVGSVIDNKKVVELPLNGRLFFQLNLLLPGAAPGVFGSQLSTQGGSIVVNGAREAQNNFLLDGIDNNDLAINLFTIPPSIDAIHEFKLQSSTYTAEFGRSGGAQINITTKSGTNEIHGTAFEFLRNDALDARNQAIAAGQGPTGNSRIQTQPVRMVDRRSGHKRPDLFLLQFRRDQDKKSDNSNGRGAHARHEKGGFLGGGRDDKGPAYRPAVPEQYDSA